MDNWDDIWFANSNRLCRAFGLLYYQVRSWHLPFKRWGLVLKSVPATVLAFSERNMQSFGLLAEFKILSLKHIGWEFCFVVWKSEFPTNVFIGWLGNSGSCHSQYTWKVSGRGTLVAPWAWTPPFLAPFSCTKWGVKQLSTWLFTIFLFISNFQFGAKKWHKCKFVNE